MRNWTKNTWLSAAMVVLLGGAVMTGCSSKEAKQEAPVASSQPAAAPAPAPVAADSTATSTSNVAAKPKKAKKANLGASSAGNSR